jgi:ligand-binding sensor domain-containing protein/two-component sensor histidine kinase
MIKIRFHFIKVLLFTLFLFMLLFIRISFTQTPNYFNYSTSAGLAGSTVFDITQDSAGYMWFATGNGLSRFDGRNFLNYTTSSGLNSNSINAVYAGTGGEIYIGSNDKGANLLIGGDITSLAPGRLNVNAHNFLYAKNRMYSYSTTYIDIIDEALNRNDYSSEKSTVPISQLITNLFNAPPGSELNSYDILAASTEGLFLCKGRVLTKAEINGLGEFEAYSGTFSRNSLLLGSTGCIYVINSDTQTGKLNLEKKIPIDFKPSQRVQKIFADTRGNIWFAMPSSGFYKILPDGNIINFGGKLGLQGAQVTKFFEDIEGNIWIGTFGSGVYCITNTFIMNHSTIDGLSDNNVYEIEMGPGGEIFCGTFNGFNILANGKWIDLNTSAGFDVFYVHKAKNYDRVTYVCATVGLLLDIKEIKIENQTFRILNIPSVLKFKNQLYTGGWNNNVVKYPDFNNTLNKELITVLGDSISQNRINEMLADSRENIWMGTALGVVMFQGSTKKTFPSNDVLSSAVNVMAIDKSGAIWFGGEKGVASYNPESQETRSFSKISGVNLSSVSALAVDKANKLWIGSNEGLFILNNGIINKINKSIGLFSNEIYSLCYDSLHNNMLIGTNSGLSILDLTAYESNSMPPFNFFIESITAGDTTYTKFDELEFAPQQNNIKITYAAILYSSPNAVEYRYSINNNYRLTELNSVEFSSLQAGTYNFSVKAFAPGRMPSREITLTFAIKPPFTETAWFSVLIIGTLILTAVLVSYGIIKRVKQKEKEKREINTKINELRHQALSAMMNPHFIFNSLNAVQHLVNKGKLLEVNEYISSLARLIRKNLDYADKSYITLDEETDKLKLYMEIENLRFNYKFDFEIIIDPAINPHRCEIPNMIIQPFVENSIWHGILPLTEKGEIIISFALNSINYKGSVYEFMTIRIKDNGVGIRSTSAKEGHISKGIKLVEERLRLLSEEMEIPSSVSAQDSSAYSSGTEVTISLPPHLYKI